MTYIRKKLVRNTCWFVRITVIIVSECQDLEKTTRLYASVRSNEIRRVWMIKNIYTSFYNLKLNLRT